MPTNTLETETPAMQTTYWPRQTGNSKSKSNTNCKCNINTHRKSRTRCPDNGKTIWAVGFTLVLLTCLQQLKSVSADEESQDFQKNSEYNQQPPAATVLLAITITANDWQEFWTRALVGLALVGLDWVECALHRKLKRKSASNSVICSCNELLLSPQIIEGKSCSLWSALVIRICPDNRNCLKCRNIWWESK